MRKGGVKMSEWKLIQNYENYAVSTSGEVKRIDSNKILKPQKTKKGYYTVRLYNDTGFKSFKIHRLVANTFIENPDDLPQINHIDEDKTNNSVENLEWCTNRYNATYGGTKKKISHKVRCVETGIVFDSIREAIRCTGAWGVGECLKGRRKTSGGYHWEGVYA